MKVKGLMGFAYIVRLIVISELLVSLTACGVAGKSPTPLPTVVLGGDGGTSPTDAPPSASVPQTVSKGDVVASAVVVPAQQAQLAFAASGNVSAVNVAVGDSVKAGQALAALDTADAQSAIAQAEADVAIAQANYDQVAAGGPAQIAANIAAAKLALLDAQNALAQLKQNAPLETAQAQFALANAQRALEEAQTDRTRMNYPRANQSTIETAQAQYELMQDALEQAQDAYDQVKNRPADDPDRARALLNLSNAQKERDKALITLNWYLGKNSDLDLAEADAQLALALAQLDAAQAHWDEVKDGPAARLLALADARVTSAQAQLELANAQTTAQSLVQAQLDAARARLELAQAQLARMTLAAPFDGVVASVNVRTGEWALIGQPILVVVDLNQLRIETTDLSERDVPKVALGQAVTVSFKALGQNATGVVTVISPLADTLGGDVVYKVIVELDTIPSGLRAGMSAEVQFGLGK